MPWVLLKFPMNCEPRKIQPLSRSSAPIAARSGDTGSPVSASLALPVADDGHAAFEVEAVAHRRFPQRPGQVLRIVISRHGSLGRRVDARAGDDAATVVPLRRRHVREDADVVAWSRPAT